MLGPLGCRPVLARRQASFSCSSPGAYVDYLEQVHGPTIVALRLAGRQGRRPELRARLVELYSAANTATDGTLAFDQEYLLVTAQAQAAGETADAKERTPS